MSMDPVSNSKVQSTLLHAALLGLVAGSTSSCGTEEKEKIVEVEKGPGTVTSTTEDTTITLDSFSSTCETRGGIVQTHASCAGSNSCAGLSYHSGSGKLSEHTCKAANICAGMSCVDLASDGGLTGQQILEGFENAVQVGADVQCNFCHGDGKEAFRLPIAPDADETESLAAFNAKSEAQLIATIAFGIHGVNADGTAYANMPGFYKNYSLAELKKLVTHIRTLPVEAKKWGTMEE